MNTSPVTKDSSLAESLWVEKDDFFFNEATGEIKVKFKSTTESTSIMNCCNATISNRDTPSLESERLPSESSEIYDLYDLDIAPRLQTTNCIEEQHTVYKPNSPANIQNGGDDRVSLIQENKLLRAEVDKLKGILRKILN